MRLRIADCGLRIDPSPPRRIEGRIACHSEANRRSRADCPWAYKSKAVSRPPRSTWWLALVLTVALLPAPACAQSQPAKSKAAQTQPAERPAPITFARSGKEVEVEILPPFGLLPESEKAVVLTAFGRTWTKPANVTQTSAWSRAKIVIPQVRVTTVFSVVNHSKEVVGEVVAYPDRDVQWDKKTLLIAIGAPQWFEQWGKAVGLPVQWSSGNTPTTLPAMTPDGCLLLILGPSAAEKTYAQFAAKAWRPAFNVLVLDADWFGEAAGPVSVAPTQMLGGLAEIAKQHWPQPLKFSSHRKCWPGIANRWAWIVDANGLPLVEELAWELLSLPRVVLSYPQWQDQLGRREQADELLLRLLTAVATLEKHQISESFTRFGPMEVWMVYPPDKQIEPKGRPVLSSLRFNRYSIIEAKSLSILDLRGTEKLPAELLDECRKIEGLIGPREGRKESNLLILGDNKMLDEWEWLKLDRAKKTINRPGVVWLSNDELPPSNDNQIRLMLKLTELGVPLGPPSQEEKKQ